MGRPYGRSVILGDDNNPMQMIRHHDIRIQFNHPEMSRNGTPAFIYEFPDICENYAPIFNLPK